MIKNKKVYICALFSVLLLATIFSTALYLTSVDGEKNSVKIGENRIDISEDFDPPDELRVGENSYQKEVAIENTGNTDAYIRVFLDFSSSDISSISEISSDGGETFYSYDEFKNHIPENWEYVPSGILGGYFYYKIPVCPGEKTPNLITNVKTTFSSAIDVDEYDVIVYAESVQTIDKDGIPFPGDTAWASSWIEFLQRK